MKNSEIYLRAMEIAAKHPECAPFYAIEKAEAARDHTTGCIAARLNANFERWFGIYYVHDSYARVLALGLMAEIAKDEERRK